MTAARHRRCFQEGSAWGGQIAFAQTNGLRHCATS
eukprot:CAMPEP_0177637180 /NCGR_PEP_ID=MMETSP0447-20121125/4837_1 /TAXON_ID=0 /ORGANISM="Stygamoeba regulata, Strain BSH-02190019" /LENGTH=34 /DNA_ID= /DNA_START= /DNA_END= /DNA_ORIENTATION=